MKLKSILMAAMASALAPAAVHAQHVHGVIEMGVVVEGNAVAVTLNAPLSDVVGFEHAPKNDAQSASIARIAAVLADADQMFGLADAAGCVAGESSLEGPAYMSGGVETDDHDDDHDHGDDDHHDHDADHDHHDDHDDHGDHGDHDHGDEGDDGHAEITANYAWTCESADQLQTLELRFIDHFAGVESIEVQVLTKAGAHVIEADQDTRSVSIASP